MTLRLKGEGLLSSFKRLIVQPISPSPMAWALTRETLAALGQMPVLPQRVALSSSIKRRFGVGVGVPDGKSVANIRMGKMQGIPTRFCRVVQFADGYDYTVVATALRVERKRLLPPHA